MVRETVVTGMPFPTMEFPITWHSIDGNRTSRPTVTSCLRRDEIRSAHSSAAEWWLRTALGPAARTAAMRQPSGVRILCPTA